MHYTEKIRSRADDAKQGDVVELAEIFAKRYGDHNFCEWFEAHHRTKPYFDGDLKYDPGCGQSFEDAANAFLERCRAAVATFFADQPSFDPARVLWATSHGPHKISIRCFVPGFVMCPRDIKRRLIRLGLVTSSSPPGPFDPAPYMTRQKLRITGSYKSLEDRRILALLGVPEPTAVQIAATLVQNTAPDDIRIEEPDPDPAPPKAAPLKRIAKRPAPTPVPASDSEPEPEPAADAPAASTAVVPAPRRGRKPKADTLPAPWRAALAAAGFRDVHSQAGFQDDRGMGFSFSSSNRSRCPCCGGSHTSNNWFAVAVEPTVLQIKSHSENCAYRRADLPEEERGLETIAPISLDAALDGLGLVSVPHIDPEATHYHTLQVVCHRHTCLACDSTHTSQDYLLRERIKHGCWTIENTDSFCRPKIFFHGELLDEAIAPVLAHPVPATFAKLFLLGHRRTLWCTPDGARVARWTGERWHMMVNVEWTAYIGGWLTTLLMAVASSEAHAHVEKKVSRAIAIAPGQSPQTRSAIVAELIQLSASIILDGNPLLLGGEGNLIELDTGLVRAHRFDDYVTKSVGYSFHQQPDEEHIARLQALMEQIYPIEEERRLVQQYAGYCLRGDHPGEIGVSWSLSWLHTHTPRCRAAKHFLCLTDRRAGSNGKSTICRLLRAVLGNQYSCDAKAELIYQQRSAGSVNDHDSGLAAFEGKRLLVFEEPAQNHTIDTARLKQLNGGGVTLSIRSAHSAETRLMDWGAKMLIAFNQDGMPKLRLEDEAFLKRILIVQHRSRFCSGRDWTLSQAEPHTFLADSTIEDAVKSSPQAILYWAMEGHAIYMAERFRSIPAMCNTWLQETVGDQDEVALWAREAVLEAPGTWLKLKDAHESYRIGGGRLGKKQFNTRMQKVYPGTFDADKSLDGGRFAAYHGLSLVPDSLISLDA